MTVRILHLGLSSIGIFAVSAGVSLATGSSSHETHEAVADAVIAEQRAALADTTDGAGYGPQSPRDFSEHAGANHRSFEAAPPYGEMNLCNIHFHEGAEHRGGEFTTYAGNGDGHGNGSGFLYDGHLSEAEMTPYDHHVGESDHGYLEPGDTIEVHFVFSSAQIEPGPTLGSCLSDAINNPQLRVETVVLVLVNDGQGADFGQMADVAMANGLYQAPNLPEPMGAIQYAGSTTGPGYNESGSPFQVTWSVRPHVIHTSIASVDHWLEGNVFEENHAHGVRNLVVNPALLSEIAG